MGDRGKRGPRLGDSHAQNGHSECEMPVSPPRGDAEEQLAPDLESEEAELAQDVAWS